jgi:DNA repair protein RecN (Recombination protein N)
VLENSERIHAALDFACQSLYDDDQSALALLGRAKKKVREVGAVDESLARFASDLETAVISLRESVDGMRRYVEGMEFDPEHLQAMQERLGVLIAFERRYAMSIDELVVQAKSWQDELESGAFEDDRRRRHLEAVTSVGEKVSAAAAALSAARRAAAGSLDTRMTRELQALMMKGAVFHTHIGFAEDARSDVVVDGTPVALLDDGVDVVHLCMRTNPGEPEGGVDRIASTGEASRVALALKKLTNAGGPGSVMIFDEIDAGVGADLGEVIAEKLLELSREYQIVCITHMPQIAARGARHLVVAKKSARGRTWVDVTAVEGAARRGEIARMLGGAQGSEHRMALASELLEKHSNRVRP